MASHSKAYRERSPEYYISRAEKIMPLLGDVIRYMFMTATVPAETFYRSCDGLLHLHKTTDPMLFSKACETALAHQNYRYGFILSLIKSKCRGLEEIYSSEPINNAPDTHANIRGKEHFK